MDAVYNYAKLYTANTPDITFSGTAPQVADALMVPTAASGTVTLTLPTGGTVAISVPASPVLNPIRIRFTAATLTAGVNIIALKE